MKNQNADFESEMNELREHIKNGKRWKVMGIRMLYKPSTIMQNLTDEEWEQFTELVESARESL
jgi:hypothetical protein